jgi:hypothetical protein
MLIFMKVQLHMVKMGKFTIQMVLFG